MKKDFIFRCKKCNHNIFVGKEKVKKLFNYDCPSCGEEAYELWILIGEGIFKEE